MFLFFSFCLTFLSPFFFFSMSLHFLPYLHSCPLPSFLILHFSLHISSSIFSLPRPFPHSLVTFLSLSFSLFLFSTLPFSLPFPSPSALPFTHDLLIVEKNGNVASLVLVLDFFRVSISESLTNEHLIVVVNGSCRRERERERERMWMWMCVHGNTDYNFPRMLKCCTGDVASGS